MTELLEDGTSIVECPSCGRRGAATADVLICSECGAKFRTSGGIE